MGILEHIVTNQAVVLTDLNSYININTLFWVVVVLAVLLLVALVYLANIMSYLKNSADKAISKSSIDHVMTQIDGNEQGELVDNNELVAVITAAIYAFDSDIPAGGFVVRSIRRTR